MIILAWYSLSLRIPGVKKQAIQLQEREGEGNSYGVKIVVGSPLSFVS